MEKDWMVKQQYATNENRCALKNTPNSSISFDESNKKDTNKISHSAFMNNYRFFLFLYFDQTNVHRSNEKRNCVSSQEKLLLLKTHSSFRFFLFLSMCVLLLVYVYHGCIILFFILIRLLSWFVWLHRVSSYFVCLLHSFIPFFMLTAYAFIPFFSIHILSFVWI